MAIYATFDFYSTSAIDIGFIRRNFLDDLIVQLVDDGELTDADNVLLARLLDFITGHTLEIVSRKLAISFL